MVDFAGILGTALACIDFAGFLHDFAGILGPALAGWILDDFVMILQGFWAQL